MYREYYHTNLKCMEESVTLCCACMYVCACMHVCAWHVVHACTYVYVCMCVPGMLCMHVRMCMYACVCLACCVCMYICACMHVCVWHVLPYLIWRTGCFVWECRGSVWCVWSLTCEGARGFTRRSCWIGGIL